MWIEHPGFVLWFTGLPCSGKTTLTLALERAFKARQMRVERLDGDVLRQSLTRDLGFSREDRVTNIERATFVAKLLSRNQVAVMGAFIAPYATMRETIRQEVTNYIEVYLSAPLEICETRDVKDMYRLAREGKIAHFTGISDPYEVPEHPDIIVPTHLQTVEESCAQILTWLEDHAYIPTLVSNR